MTRVVSAVLIAVLLVAFWRVYRGPKAADRLIALQLFSTVGVASLLLLGAEADHLFYKDVALTFALLAAVGAFVLTKRVWGRS